VQLAIALPPVSVSSLRTIASIRVNGAQSVNTTTTPTVTITNRQFVTNGQVLITQALEQTPGVTVEHYDGGMGSVSTLTIRGAGGFTQGGNTGYEVLVLQDGQPMRNGEFGDADLSTLTPAIYSRVELLKGVGGTSLFGANTIGGTLNLVTRDPLATEGGEFIGGLGQYGTTNYDLIETNTFGRFGYIFDLHRLGTDGPVPGNFIADYHTNVFGTNGAPCTGVADCGPFWHPTQNFVLKSDLFKIKYQFSPVTYLTLSSQNESDLRDQLGLLTNPTTASDGSAIDPLGFPYYFGFPGDQLWNTQPKLSADLHTQVLGGDFIARSYGGILERVVDGNGEPPGICCFLQRSVDRLYGDEAYWTRLFGRHQITVAAGANGDSFFFAAQGSGGPLSFKDLNYTSGKQIERTYMARDEYQASPEVNLTLTGYYSTYDTLQVKRFDPRLGVVYRPNVSTAVRFSVASGFAAPNLADLYNPLETTTSAAVSDPRCPSTYQFGACAAPSGNLGLKSETGLGYDFGMDYTFGYRRRGLVSFDLYRTNLHGHIYFVDDPAPPGTGNFTSGANAGLPILFINHPINLAGSVYTGFEFNGAYPVTHNFSLTGYYTTQAAYPFGLDTITQINAGDTVNNQQFQGVPVHMLGYGVRYVNDAGAEAFFRGDYQMWNNSYSVNPFWIYNTGITLPAEHDTDLTFTWQNIFNKNATIFSIFDGGVPYPGFTGPFAETAHPTNPHTIMVTLTHRWGSLKNP
jgi:outer membrane receptor protein involved in Fe transport